MKLSEAWLREWVNPAVTVDKLVKQLTMAGLEVDNVESVAAPFTEVKVGYVKEVQAHPNAERLRVCQVDVGQPELLTIVCGASNVRADIKVPVAVIGAVLGPDFRIKKAKLRGVESQGMICSAQELGLAENSQGILILPEDAPLGTDFRQYWQLDDHAITVELTPNRGDCASVIGLAREVAALNQALIKPLDIEPVAASCDAQWDISVSTPELCPYYVGRIIHQVNAKAMTPWWLAERLRRSGQRTINPIVDVLNYVLLELGQPMHAFDLSKLKQAIVVRHAQAGEKLALLNGQTVLLKSDDLVIADQQKPLALAGIMGGSESEVQPETQAIFLESAFFEPVAMAGKARRHGLHTDSSYRFERGVDPALARIAIERATALILSICGGEAGPVLEQRADVYLPQLAKIDLRKSRIKQLLGIELTDTTITTILTSLKMQLTASVDGWQVQVPSHRFDLKLEVDLIEELARVYGYDNIQATPPQWVYKACAAPESQIELSRIQQLLVDRGYHEAITYSFVAPKLNEIFAQAFATLRLSNPISSDLAVMRNHLWPSLLAVLQHNQNRQQNRVRLFEVGLRFGQEAEHLEQTKVIAGLVTGTRYPEQWAENNVGVDFFDVKADVEALIALTGREAAFSFEPTQKAGLHPGQTAKILCQDQVVGYIGALHPSIGAQLDLNSAVYLFEIDLAVLSQAAPPVYVPLSKYPSIRRDMALIIAKEIPVAAVLAKIQAKEQTLIQQVQVFDVYQGQGIAEDKKSIAISITMQHSQRTLTEQDINELLQAVLNDLQQTFDVKLREA